LTYCIGSPSTEHILNKEELRVNTEYVKVLPLESRDDETITQSKQNQFKGMLHTFFGYETKTGEERILVIFQDRPMFSHINGKISLRPFE